MFVVLEDFCLNACWLFEPFAFQAMDYLRANEIVLVPVHVQQLYYTSLLKFNHITIIDSMFYHVIF